MHRKGDGKSLEAKEARKVPAAHNAGRPAQKEERGDGIREKHREERGSTMQGPGTERKEGVQHQQRISMRG